MCFRKVLHLILMHFIPYIQCFEEFFQKLGYFFKNYIFLEFRLIQSVFRSIKITFKILCELLSVSINRNWFSINQKSWISFFKSQIWLIQITFSKLFQTSFFSLQFRQAQFLIFCRFQPNFWLVFPLPRPVWPYNPFFFIYFQFYMHFFMHWRVIFRLCIFWGFWCLKPYFVKLINGFCCYIVMFLIYDGKFDQFGVLWWIQNSRACIEPELGFLF